jgi:hypothetical protein
MSSLDNIEDGQFDDAPNDLNTAPTTTQPEAALNPRAGHNHIDEFIQGNMDWSDGGSVSDEEDGFEDEGFEEARPEDEDWEIAERGAFTALSSQEHASCIVCKTSQNSITAYGNISQYSLEMHKVLRLL